MTTVVIGAGQAGLAVSRELGQRRRRARGARTRPGRAGVARPLGQLQPGHAELDPRPPGQPVRRRRPGGPRAPRRDRRLPRGVRRRRTRPARSARAWPCTASPPARAGRAAARHVRRPDRRRRRRRVHRCLPAAAPPAVADAFPAGPRRSSTPRRTATPDGLPDGPVLVVGSGQTGIQLAEELHLAGRDVVLSCGRAPWGPRRPGGIDIVTWLVRVGFYDQPRVRAARSRRPG